MSGYEKDITAGVTKYIQYISSPAGLIAIVVSEGGSHVPHYVYTDHEHLDRFGLINMNGRLYDPVVGKVLSPDNNVQNAYSTQDYNRYSYVKNNPLIYNDPDGQNSLLLFLLTKGAFAGGLGYVLGTTGGGVKIIFPLVDW